MNIDKFKLVVSTVLSGYLDVVKLYLTTTDECIGKLIGKNIGLLTHIGVKTDDKDTCTEDYVVAVHRFGQFILKYSTLEEVHQETPLYDKILLKFSLIKTFTQ